MTPSHRSPFSGQDLNRVREKPYTQTEEGCDRPDDEVAREAWYRYRLRDDSVIVDLFQGQYKSKLVCPACGKVRVVVSRGWDVVWRDK